MSTQIFYFSGTGNTLYAAKKIGDGISECSLIPMVKALKEGLFNKRAA